MNREVTKEEISQLFSREISHEMIAFVEEKLSKLKLNNRSGLESNKTDTSEPGVAEDFGKGDPNEEYDDGDSDDSQVYGNYRNPFQAASEEDESESDEAFKLKGRGRGRETFEAPSDHHYRDHIHCPPLKDMHVFRKKYPCDCTRRYKLLYSTRTSFIAQAFDMCQAPLSVLLFGG